MMRFLSSSTGRRCRTLKGYASTLYCTPVSHQSHVFMSTSKDQMDSSSSSSSSSNQNASQKQHLIRNSSSNQSVSPSEIAKFSALADTWWDTRGPFRQLHKMNPTRLSFIRSTLCQHFGRDSCCEKPLDGLTILDVGCGGGLLCEPLSRMGAKVVGIDAAETNIKVARAHSVKDPLTASIEYFCLTAEQLVQEKQQPFDVVISLEVIEHVSDPKLFLHSLSALTRPGGAVVISTINRSLSGFFLAIVAAEHLLQWVPKGTHEWTKFVTPDEVALLMAQTSIKLNEMAGMVFNPLTTRWSLSEDTSVNYIAFGVKMPHSSPVE